MFGLYVNGWVQVPSDLDLPDGQQDRDMVARELLVKFQCSEEHPMVELNAEYGKVRPPSAD